MSPIIMNFTFLTLKYICIIMSETLKKVGNYKLIKKIGTGATSEVFQGRKDGEIQKYAIKMIKIKNMSKEQKEMIAKQVIIIKSIEHPNIVKLHQTLETSNNYYLVFEFCEKGDLEKYLKENMDNLLPADKVRKIIKCIADALFLLHAKGIAHRDIKLANILLKKDLTIKLADFGFARESNNEEVMMKTFCGTPITMAPQILQGKPYDKKCDLWSLGVILFQLIYGKLPFPIDQGYVTFVNKVTNERVKFPLSPVISQSLTELIYGCLERDQYKRYSIEDFLQSKWMKERVCESEVIEQGESVSEVLKKVSKATSKYESKEKESIEKEKVELEKLEKLLAYRIYEVLYSELKKILNRHVNLRAQLVKLVDEIKQLKQALTYYDYEILKNIRGKRIKLRREGEKDVELPVASLRTLLIPETLHELQPEPCQIAPVLINYLKKLSLLQQFDIQKKKGRYQTVIKFLDFIQNFQLQLVLFFNNGCESDISLQSIANHICDQKFNEKYEEQIYCPALNQITIAMQCRQKSQKFRECASILKTNCLKRIDSIQREINGY